MFSVASSEVLFASPKQLSGSCSQPDTPDFFLLSCTPLQDPVPLLLAVLYLACLGSLRVLSTANSCREPEVRAWSAPMAAV